MDRIKEEITEKGLILHSFEFNGLSLHTIDHFDDWMRYIIRMLRF